MYENFPLVNYNKESIQTRTRFVYIVLKEVCSMNIFMRIALALVIVGALNWGMIGFFNFDVVASLFGGQDTLPAKVVYAIVGLSGLATIGLLFKPNEKKVVPVEVEKEVEPEVRFDGIRNVNFNIEFGEELDANGKRKKVDRSLEEPKE